jgi:DNA-directed RNA polymerase sigma subunit (sigma70/sigma32)
VDFVGFADENDGNPFEGVARAELRGLVRQRLQLLRLSARERYLLLMGVMADEPASYIRLAVTFGVPPATVCQWEEELLLSLRNSFLDLANAA